MLVTGEVPRTTGYEPGFPAQQAWTGGSWQPDPLVLDDLAAMNPGMLAPAHCTCWRAQHAMSARFPAAFIPSTVGTSYHL